MEMEISFVDKVMKMMVYIEMDVLDQLLLTKGVCSKLGIVTYHPLLVPQDIPKHATKAPALVPSVCVCLLRSLRLPH